MQGLFDPADSPPPYIAYAQVAPEQGLDSFEGLTYGVRPELADLMLGDRVLVPLGRSNKPVNGYIIGLSPLPPADMPNIKPVLRRDNMMIRLPRELLSLAEWISQYYCSPLGMVLVSMLPAAVKRGIGVTNRIHIQLAPAALGKTAEELAQAAGLKGKQASILAKALELHAQGRLPMPPLQLAQEGGARTDQPVMELIGKGLLEKLTVSQIRAVWSEYAAEAVRQITLNEHQAAAVKRIIATLGQGFKPLLLHGVTGSGKTEVYIRAIEPVIESGAGALVLVPEIALTPQTAGRFIARFSNVAVLHSGLTAAQRHQQWSLIRSGWAKVVVGARSAVFAPMERIGLIIVDEEHDGSYKQDQAPRYHARDVAIKRAQKLSIPIVLGSATPSLESYYNATERKIYELIELPARVADQALPRVQISDMAWELRRQASTGKRGFHLLGSSLEKSLAQTLDLKSQAILLLNRRGFAHYIACPDDQCGWMMNCDHCDVAMVYHVDKSLPRGGLVRCHYCGYEHLLPTTCMVCGKKVKPFGLGTQRVEEEIARKFPSARMVRMDSDSMRTGRDYQQTLDSFRAGRVDILVGTQMIAKGLDFPNVRLVGVISADTSLNMPDFRASERSFQLISQVAGRSGRSSEPGIVIVQTFTPDHPAIQLASRHDYQGFARLELPQRKAMGLPPWTRMARLVIRDIDFEKCGQNAKRIGQILTQANGELGGRVMIRGPIPATIARIADHHRFSIELIADSPADIQHLLAETRRSAGIRSDAQVAIDVDPISLL